MQIFNGLSCTLGLMIRQKHGKMRLTSIQVFFAEGWTRYGAAIYLVISSRFNALGCGVL